MTEREQKPTCARCGREFAEPCPEYVPTEGDVIVCLSCGEVHLLDDELRHVRAPDGHRARDRREVRHLQRLAWSRN